MEATSEVAIYGEKIKQYTVIEIVLVLRMVYAHGDNNTFAVSGIADYWSAGNTVKVQWIIKMEEVLTSPRTV